MKTLLYAIAAIALLTTNTHAGGLAGTALPTMERPYDQLSADELRAKGLPAKLTPAFAAALNNYKATPNKAVLSPSHLPVAIQTGRLKLSGGISAQFPCTGSTPAYSSNWSAQVLCGGGQPESTAPVNYAPPPPPNPSFPGFPNPAFYCTWAGLDGTNDLPLWQAGYCYATDQTLGSTNAQAFLECYPNDPNIITLFPVAVGDTVYYTVWVISPGVAAVYVQDKTTGVYYLNTNYSCNPPGTNIETVVEDPGTNTNILADYGTIEVSGADEVNSGVGFGDPSALTIIMVSPPNRDAIISVPTPIDETDVDFQYIVNGSPPPPCTVGCPTPPPPPPPPPPRQPPVPPKQPVPPRHAG